MVEANTGTVKLIAHRGKGPTSKLSGKGSATEDVPPQFTPENTLKSFRQAIKEEADGIEFDIYISKDGVPVIVHDDPLNINVRGADRSGKDLGLVSEKTLAELKKYDMGQGEQIPTLQETVDLFVESNQKRAEKGLAPLIMNVELKGKNTGEPSWLLIQKYIDDGLIRTEDVVYCSFEHGELAKIRKLDPNAKLSPSIKTDVLFEKDKIIIPGWFIPLDEKYKKEGLQFLKNLHDNLKVAAFDPLLFDINKEIVDFAKANEIALFASTTDFREFSNKAFLHLLVNANKEVQIYFKTDEPGIIRSILEERADIIGLDLSEVIILESTEIMQIKEEQLKRIPKPGQPESTLNVDLAKTEKTADKVKNILEKIILEISQDLKFYIIDNTKDEENTKALIKAIETLGYLKPYMGKLLSIDDNAANEITNILEKLSDELIKKTDKISTNLKARAESIIIKLDEKEIELLEKTASSSESKIKIDYLKNYIKFYEKDTLASNIQMLNEIVLKAVSSPVSDQASLITNLTTLKQIFHIDHFPHKDININDKSVASLLETLKSKIVGNEIIDTDDLISVKVLNHEILSVLQTFKHIDVDNQPYWDTVVENLSNIHELLMQHLEQENGIVPNHVYGVKEEL